MAGGWAAAASAAGDILGGITSGIFQNAAQNKDINFQQNMYAAQRQAALDDWNRQNDYNSPINQMKRLKDAGLNPMLAYGNVNQMSAPIRSTDTPKVDFKPINPLAGLGPAVGDAISTYQDVSKTEALVELTHTNQAVKEQEIALKAAQTMKVLGDTAKLGIDTDKAMLSYRLQQSLFDTTIEQAKENVRKTQTQTTVMNDANARAEAMQSKNLEEAVTRIANNWARNGLIREQTRTEHGKQGIQQVQQLSMTQQMEYVQQQIKNAEKQGVIKDAEIKLLRTGARPGDPAYMRMVQELLSMIFPNATYPGNKVDSLQK